MNQKMSSPVTRAQALSTIKARQLNIAALGLHGRMAKADPFARVARDYVALGLRLDRIEVRFDCIRTAQEAM